MHTRLSHDYQYAGETTCEAVRVFRFKSFLWVLVCREIKHDKWVIEYYLPNQAFPRISLQKNSEIAAETDNMKFEKEISTVLKARQPDSDMVNVIDALGYTTENFQDAFDIALEMDRQNLVKLLYSNFDARKVIVEFTLLGKK